MAGRQNRRGFAGFALSLSLSLSMLGFGALARDRQTEGHGLLQSGPVLAPLPPKRPTGLRPHVEPAQDSSSGQGGGGPSTCIRVFEENGGVVLPSAGGTSTGECAIEDPVTFQRVTIPDGSKIELDSAITVRCPFALEVIAWVRDDLTALMKRENSQLAKLAGVGGHACRARNGDAGAPISEHASGNALDVGGLLMQDGRALAFVGNESESRSIREAVQKSACQRFTTVLGPGADSSHKDHLHLDMRERPRGFRICQWTVE
ncbi:extensin family protein [Bosea sp. BIWAKO-01]|uniref:extensin-like domain-containing protein n=1 Tax=Bosea sp. BIWAKO-01 TaxID=506668 RepID=UPI00159F0D9A|nr:extensin family protein [Bosea sp. BIWAKO-01]